MADNEQLPAINESDLRATGLPALMKMSPGLALFFNDAVYARSKAIAGHMAKAEGMMPRHLLGKPEACFAVISRAITWNLDPYSVAMATYQTPGGSIGYMGVLIQSILESSNALEGGVKFEHGGDWSKVQGKFKINESPKGGRYPVPTWGPEEAKDLYVVVSAKIKNELEPRTLRFDLNEAFPLNSPLWATAPNRQICYTAVRAFANIATPALLMGVPFDVDPTGFYGDPITEINPRPNRSDFTGEMKPPPANGKTGFERKEAQDVEPVKTEEVGGTETPKPEASAARPEPKPEPVAPETGGTEEPASEPVVESEPDQQPEPEEPENDGPSKLFLTAEKMVVGLIGGLAELGTDDLPEMKKRGRMSIDSLEGLAEDERDVLRGRFTQAILEEERKRGKKKGKAK